jgi:hypothetical protein
MRKRRAGKLPGDTAATLKAWWQAHSKWPYPTVRDTIPSFILQLVSVHDDQQFLHNSSRKTTRLAWCRRQGYN